MAGAAGQAQLNVLSLVRDNVSAAANGRPVTNVVNGLDPLVHRRTAAGG